MNLSLPTPPPPLGSPLLQGWGTHLQDLILEHGKLIGISGCEVIEDLDILGHGWCGFWFVAPAWNRRGCAGVSWTWGPTGGSHFPGAQLPSAPLSKVAVERVSAYHGEWKLWQPQSVRGPAWRGGQPAGSGGGGWQNPGPLGTARPAPAQATLGVSRPSPQEPRVDLRNERVTSIPGKQPSMEGRPDVCRAVAP